MKIQSDWAEYWGATYRVSDRQGGEYRLPGRPWKFSDAELPLPGAPSEQGEQNVEICRELGHSDVQIEAMQDNGALLGNVTARMITMVTAQMQARQASHAADRIPREAESPAG